MPTVPAAIRFNNPGAAWPRQRDELYGGMGYATLNDGQGNKIARFPDPVSGLAANMDLFATKYVGLTMDGAIRRWSGGNNSESATCIAIKKRSPAMVCGASGS
jgi:hypothetical protein